MFELNNIIFYYGFAALVTAIFIFIGFIYFWFTDSSTIFIWKDVLLTILCIILWPIFWILFVASNIGRFFK